MFFACIYGESGAAQGAVMGNFDEGFSLMIRPVQTYRNAVFRLRDGHGTGVGEWLRRLAAAS